VLRRIAGQSLAATFEEYKQYTGQAQAITRDLDRLMIESFDLRVFKKQIERIPVEFRPDWIA
jgi:hypothetical protein